MATTISVKVNKGQTYSQALTKAEVGNPTRTNYTFAGWNTKSDGTGETRLSSQVAVKSETVYAQWQPISYTLSFNFNGGSGSPSSKSVTYNSQIGTLPAPTRANDIFNGWKIGLTPITSETIWTYTSNQTATAQWTAIPITYTVTFDLAGGTRTGGGALSQSVAEGGSATPPTVSRTGYSFAGWSGSYTNVTSNRTITATWTAVGKPTNYISIQYIDNNVRVGSTYAVTSTLTVKINSVDAGGSLQTLTISNGSTTSNQVPAQFVMDWYISNISPSEDSNYYYA